MRGAIRDVTDLHDARGALEDSENRWRAIWKNSPNSVSILGLDRKILDVNRTLALSRDQIIGKYSWTFTPPDQQQRISNTIEEVRRTGKGKTLSSSHEIEGERFWFETSYIPVLINDEVAYFITKFVDRTPEKRAERELISAARKAGMAEIASGVLHNVGNILTSIRISSRALRDGLKNSKRDGLDRVVALLESHQHDLPSFFAPTAPGSNLAQLLAGLSEQMEREHNERLKDAQRLEGLLDHVSEILRAQAANCSDVSVNAEIRPKELFEEALGICDRSHPIQDEGLIKDFDEVSTIVGDPNQILEILVYLIGNARDSMNECKDRGGRLALEIHRMPNEIIAFSVQDNGKGIEDEDLSRLFLLQQGATDKEAGGGFGLHGCANSATAMGGRIQVHSNAPEAGATFTLLLPLTTPDTLHTR